MRILSKIFRILPSFKGKFRIASVLLKSEFNKTQPIEFTGKNNLRYSIPNTIETVGKELFVNGVYETETIDVIKKLLNKGSIFFDVGANLGAISLPMAKITNATVHAFEPSKFVYKYLEMNVRNNGLTSITLNNCAVHSQDNSDIEFFASDNKYGGSSLVPTYTQTSYSVKTVSLDAYCEKNKIHKIDVLKVDVQGFEIEVLKGCYSLIMRKAIDNIIFEFEEWAERHAHLKPGASQEFLLANGYELFTLKNEKINSNLISGSHMLWAKPKLKN